MKKAMSFRLSEPAREKLARLSAETGLSGSNLIELAIHQLSVAPQAEKPPACPEQAKREPSQERAAVSCETSKVRKKGGEPPPLSMSDKIAQAQARQEKLDAFARVKKC